MLLQAPREGRCMRLLQILCRYLPSPIVYLCAIRVWGEATTGKYGTTDVKAITASEAVQRFARIHGLRGHGADEHYDSNRRLARDP